MEDRIYLDTICVPRLKRDFDWPGEFLNVFKNIVKQIESIENKYCLSYKCEYEFNKETEIGELIFSVYGIPKGQICNYCNVNISIGKSEYDVNVCDNCLDRLAHSIGFIEDCSHEEALVILKEKFKF